MKDIVIFENERQMIEGSFNAMNIAFYDGQLTFKYYSSSQEALPFNKLIGSDIVFIDIELAPKSELDGFNLIKVLISEIGIEKIAILTGYVKFDNILRESGYHKIPILRKPIDFMKLNKFINDHFSK